MPLFSYAPRTKKKAHTGPEPPSVCLLLLLTPLRVLVFPWLFPLLRMLLLVSPMVILVMQNQAQQMSSLDIVAATLIWAVLFQQWAFREGIGDEGYDDPDDLQGDLLVVVVATLGLLLLTDHATPLLMPLVCVMALLYCLHIERIAQGGSEEKVQAQKNHAWKPSVWMRLVLTLLVSMHGFGMAYMTQRSDPTLLTVPSILLGLSSCTALLLVQRPDPLLYLMQWMAIQLALSFYFYSCDVLAMWTNLVWIGLVFVVVVRILQPPKPAPSRQRRAILICSIQQHLVALLGSVAKLVRATTLVVVRVLSAKILYFLVLFVSFFVLASNMTTAWHTSHATFPDELRRDCKNWLLLVDIIQPFYEITSDRDVQKIFYPAAPEIGIVRTDLFRIITPVYPYLQQCDQGITHTFVPYKSLSVLYTFVLGPFLSFLAVLCRVFANGAAFSDSRVFWVLSSFFTILFFVSTQLMSSARVVLVRVLFSGSQFSRTYTSTGELTFTATVAMFLASLALSVLMTSSGHFFEHAGAFCTKKCKRKTQTRPSSALATVAALAMRKPATTPVPSKKGYARVQKEEDHVHALSSLSSLPLPPPPRPPSVPPPPPLPPSLDHIPTTTTANPPKRKKPCLWRCQTWIVQHIPSYVWVFAAFLVALLATLALWQSPISSLRVVKKPTTGPSWLVLTTMDMLSPGIKSFEQLLFQALGASSTEGRLALLALSLLNVALGKLSCLPCLCIDLSAITNAYGDVADFFTNDLGFRRRRRMLLSIEESIHDFVEQEGLPPLNYTSFLGLEDDPPPTPFRPPATIHKYAPRRALLQTTTDDDGTCTSKPSSSCKGLSVCLSDVVRPIMKIEDFAEDLIEKGWEIAMNFIIHQILSRIPVIGKLIASFEHVVEVPAMEAFALFSDLENLLHLPSLSRLLPDWHPPGLYLPSTHLLVILLTGLIGVVGCALLSGVGALFFGVVFRSTIITAILSLYAGFAYYLGVVFYLVDEVDTLGYNIEVGWVATPAYMCLGTFFLFFLATFLFVTDSFFDKPPPKPEGASLPLESHVHSAPRLSRPSSSIKRKPSVELLQIVPSGK